MKISYIVLKGIPLGGGIEKYTDEIGTRLVKMGHDVTVYTMNHYCAGNCSYNGMKILPVTAVKSKSFEKISASFIATLKYCLSKRSDIVHFHAFGPAMFNFIPRLINQKVVVQGHGIEWKRSRFNLAGRLFLKLTEVPSIKFAHVLTVVSRTQQQYIKEKYKRESIYIPTGVNPPQIEPPDLIRKYGLWGDDYILFAARLVQEKGAHYLLNAYNMLNSDLKLVIAGDAPHEKKYKAKLNELAKENKNIIFTGFVTGKLLHELFSNCYIFVLPSEVEGLPTALLEAMSYGNCCLVSDIPENLEALNGLGYCFKNKDEGDLAIKLDFLLNNRESANQFKEKAKSYVIDNYSWDDIALKFESLYENLLSSSERGYK